MPFLLLFAAGQPLHGARELGRALRIGVRQACRASANAKPVQPLALRDDRRHRRAGLGRSACNGFEVDVGGEVLLAGTVEHGREGVAANSLQRVARRASHVAVIDEERDASVGREPARYCRDRLVASGRGLDDFTVAVEGEPARGNHHAAFDGADMLTHRKGVQELVGDEQERPVRKIIGQIMPLRIGHGLTLRLPEDRTGLDQMRFTRKPADRSTLSASAASVPRPGPSST